MPGNSFGQAFRVTTYGESHGGGVGCVIDGCPPGIAIDLNLVQAFLDRRKPGQSHLSTPRAEEDRVECLSGLEQGKTLGTPISLMVRNKDAKKEHYDDLKDVFRPSHADFTTVAKYGVRASSGGGRASARETIGRVAAAAIAEQMLAEHAPQLRVIAFVDRVKDIAGTFPELGTITRAQVEANALRCPAPEFKAMEQLIVDVKNQGDSVGGSITCVINGCPAGLGDPVFDKLEADLAKAVLSLPASKAFEVGSGIAGTYMLGSQHNDAFTMEGSRVRTVTNRSGGVQGGIANGELIYFRVGFKPVATIFKEQATVNASGQERKVKPKEGRHDPCVLPRAVPMVEAMALLVIADHFLRQKSVQP